MNTIVTGTASGIGKAVAEKFLREGHAVYGFDLRESAISHPCYRHFVQDIRADAVPDLPPVEILINNAGTLDEAEAPALRSVLFIASASARSGAEFPLYVASKAGIVGYMKNLSLALAKRGVTCNSISPGGVITPANRHILESEELYAAVKAETLLGKWARSEEVADLAYYLTVINRSITGEDILMDNGEMLRSNFIW